MIAPVIIPKLGMTMVEASLVAWKAEEGGYVRNGDVVLTIETEKVSYDIPAGMTGYLHILVEKGNVARVGQVVGKIAETKNEYDEIAQKVIKESEEAVKKQIDENETITKADAEPTVSASPAARKLAKKLNINISLVKGTGPNGRIIEKDVIGYDADTNVSKKMTPMAKKIAKEADFDANTITLDANARIKKQDVIRELDLQHQKLITDSQINHVQLTGMRKSISEAMYESIHKTAQASISMDVDVTDALKMYGDLREIYISRMNIKFTLTDLMIRATCNALKLNPIINSTLINDEIMIYDSVNIGIAVSLPHGLIVPVMKNAHKKNLFEIASERKSLIDRARDGKLSVEDVMGGTFTISNMSTYGIDASTPILRRPENGILVFGGIKKKPAVYKDEITIRSIMVISLTLDHQVLDGVPAAKFLLTVRDNFENPCLLIN